MTMIKRAKAKSRSKELFNKLVGYGCPLCNNKLIDIISLPFITGEVLDLIQYSLFSQFFLN